MSWSIVFRYIVDFIGVEMLILPALLLLCVVDAFNHNVLLKKAPLIAQNPTKLSSIRKFGADIVNKSNLGGMKRLKMSAMDSVVENTASKPLPVHAGRVEGKLANGLSYIILPNANPEGRFEGHLEVLSGSAHELTNQQGIAHLLEHTVYMGSSKRASISGTGSRTNAYTDFQHTVFYAACPTIMPDTMFKRPMLPMAFDALIDALTCRVDDYRLEKERAAVLSEASMVNKMDYRVECQILATLHNENRISKRFPIGKEDQLKAFTKEDLQFFHDTHYRPDNAILYVVGDVAIPYTIETIQQKFGSLKPLNDYNKILQDSGEYPAVSMKHVNRHFPPLIHRWSMSPKAMTHLLPDELIKPAELQNRLTVTDNSTGMIFTEQNPTNQPAITTFVHENLKSFSFHLFAKRPIEPITTELALKRDLLRRLVVSALQIRLNVEQRQTPLFTMIDFNQLNWPREGCAVCSLDLTADVSQWKLAIKTSIQQIKRMGLYGMSAAELARYKHSMLSEIKMLAEQSEGMMSEDLVTTLMEHEAVGNTFMDPKVKFQLTESLLQTTTLAEVNAIAKELCEHLSHINLSEGIMPVAIIACSPTVDRNGQPCAVSEEDVKAAVNEALSEPIEQTFDTPIPDTLITNEQLKSKLGKYPPNWVPTEGKAQHISGSAMTKLDVLQKKLSNGIRVNMKSIDAESHKMSLRLYVPGGRLVESTSLPGTVLLGTKTMQEGGAFLNMTREEVELFCIDHLIQVEITTTSEALIFDLSAPTTTGPGGQVTGPAAVFQIAHILLTDFKYESDAFERARQFAHEQFDSTVKGLETMCLESLTKSLCNEDPRFLQPNHQQLQELTLEKSVESIRRQLNPHNVEVNIVGDMSLDDMQTLSLAYLGTVPPAAPIELKKEAIKAKVLGKSSTLGIYQMDSDERAMGYLAGPAPNDWGILSDGSNLANLLQSRSKERIIEELTGDEHRKHPAFGYVALKVLSEVANRRLFSLVREERQLTYDANFNIQNHDTIHGGWYLVSVTSSPTQVSTALTACQEALTSLKDSGVTNEGVSSAKRTILNRYYADSYTNKGWVERLSGTQLENNPYKSLQTLADFESVLSSITVKDIQEIAELFNFTEDNMTQCVGVTAPELPNEMKSLFK